MKKTILTLLLIFNISLLFAQLDDTSSTNNGAMIFGDGTGTLYQFAGDQRGTDTTNQSQGGFGILSGSHQISPIVWMYGNTNRNAFQVRKKGYNSTVQNGSTLFHVGATGNVGIGTTTPREKFQIGSSYTFHDGGHKVIGFMYAPSGGVDLDVTKYAAELRFDPNSGDLRIGTSSAINNTPTTRLTIGKNGNTGIGTTDTKGFRLGVKGKIAAEEVKVAIYNNWSDFVFENEYNLPSLKEVEKHINEKGHLKDIPSASEVAKNGIFLGDMNAKLLQKIEELTLYTIQQQKELEVQRKAFETQHHKNKTLEARLEALEAHLKN